METIYPCPACGFVVFAEPPGSYAICPVCGWEDDPLQLANPAYRGGANRESLAELQQEILREIPAEVTDHDGFTRDLGWRPVSPEESQANLSVRTPIRTPDYYWR